MERIVHIYELKHGSMAYIGSAIDPWKRLGTHQVGNGAIGTRALFKAAAPMVPELIFLDRCDESDRDLVEDTWMAHAVLMGRKILNITPASVQHLDPEVAARGARILGRITGPTNVRKMLAANAANGYKAQRENGRNCMRKLRANPTPALRRAWRENLRKMHAANAANGYEAQKRSIRKAHKASAANGYKAQKYAGRLAMHNRWHVNRDLIKPGCQFCEEVKE